jgi:exosortase
VLTGAAAKNVLLAALLAFLVAESPFTPNERLSSYAAGLFVALIFLAVRTYQLRTAIPTPTSEEEWLAPVSSARSVFRIRAVFGIPLAVWGCLLLLGAVAAPTLKWMYREWTISVWVNDHGLLMAVLMVLLARSVLRHDAGVDDPPSRWGFAFLGAGLGLVVLDSGIQTRYLSALGLLIALPGLTLVLLGPRRTRELRVVFLLGLFTIPIPYTLGANLLLRDVSTAGVIPLLELIGIAVWRKHSVLTMENQVFVVSDACSGFATLYASIAIAAALACYCASNRRRIALLAAVVPLALAAYVLRVLALVLLAVWGGDALMDTSLHEASGVGSFVLVLVVLFSLADRDSLREAFS